MRIYVYVYIYIYVCVNMYTQINILQYIYLYLSISIYPFNINAQTCCICWLDPWKINTFAGSNSRFPFQGRFPTTTSRCHGTATGPWLVIATCGSSSLGSSNPLADAGDVSEGQAWTEAPKNKQWLMWVPPKKLEKPKGDKDDVSSTFSPFPTFLLIWGFIYPNTGPKNPENHPRLIEEQPC